MDRANPLPPPPPGFTPRFAYRPPRKRDPRRRRQYVPPPVDPRIAAGYDADDEVRDYTVYLEKVDYYFDAGDENENAVGFPFQKYYKNWKEWRGLLPQTQSFIKRFINGEKTEIKQAVGDLNVRGELFNAATQIGFKLEVCAIILMGLDRLCDFQISFCRDTFSTSRICVC
jgi:hypothetical protein